MADPMTIATPEHLRRMPKVELHCHVEGAARAATIMELAARNDVTLPVDDLNELFPFANLDEFLAVALIFCGTLRTADDFHRITYEALEDGAAAGVRYREMFFSPSFAIEAGIPLEVVWAGIKAGIRDARTDLGIGCRMILGFDKSWPVEHAVEMAVFAGREPDRDLMIGLGGDSVEKGIDYTTFAPAYEEARRHGLRCTVHAGEDGPPDNIRIAIEQLQCERIDHGCRLIEDPDLTAQVADLRIPLTVCPTSNVLIANAAPDVRSHPYGALRRAGVLATLNPDNPGMLRNDIAEEYATVAEAYGYSLDDMEQISLDGIEGSWAPDDEKATRRREFLAEFDALRLEYGLPPRLG
jgi:adenosine deaminase